MGVLQKSGVGMVKQMLEVIKTQLAKEIPVHYHLSDIEPRLTPLELMKLEQLHKDTLLLLNQFESRLAQVERERDAAVRAISDAQHYIKNLGAVQYGLQQLEKWDYYIKRSGVREQNTKEEIHES